MARVIGTVSGGIGDDFIALPASHQKLPCPECAVCSMEPGIRNLNWSLGYLREVVGLPQRMHEPRRHPGIEHGDKQDCGNEFASLDEAAAPSDSLQHRRPVQRL